MEKILTTNELKAPKDGTPRAGEVITTQIIKPKGIPIEKPDPGSRRGEGFENMITTENVEIHRKKYLDSQKMTKVREARKKQK